MPYWNLSCQSNFWDIGQHLLCKPKGLDSDSQYPPRSREWLSHLSSHWKRAETYGSWCLTGQLTWENKLVETVSFEFRKRHCRMVIRYRRIEEDIWCAPLTSALFLCTYTYTQILPTYTQTLKSRHWQVALQSHCYLTLHQGMVNIGLCFCIYFSNKISFWEDCSIVSVAAGQKKKN